MGRKGRSERLIERLAPYEVHLLPGTLGRRVVDLRDGVEPEEAPRAGPEVGVAAMSGRASADRAAPPHG